jgi:hypothetical protein
MKGRKKEFRKIMKELKKDRWDRPYHKDRGRKGKSYLKNYDCDWYGTEDKVND